MPESSTNPPPADYGATAAPYLLPHPTSKPPTASRIEPKVWLANERTWLNWVGLASVRLVRSRTYQFINDVIAPLIISGSLFLAILVNFILRAIDNERHKNSDDIPKAPWIAAPASNRFPPPLKYSSGAALLTTFLGLQNLPPP
ncbi:hypothetical protein PSHT_16416 [Puccinia striiformis]|uniref:DUF202 domain-containing protein n=1 Tax=Puccinia striiformis TaxID=27350 RepID=A0A2S4UA26_9BASI|nr:hypothetical protein PSHT_16416 [Puccinia striiformis]